MVVRGRRCGPRFEPDAGSSRGPRPAATDKTANPQRASSGGARPTSRGSLGPVETTSLLWQLVARSSRASRCLCFEIQQLQNVFAFPIYSEIISPIISAQPSHTEGRALVLPGPVTVSGVTLGGGRSGRCALVLQPGFRGICRPALSSRGGGGGGERRYRTNRCTGLAQQCTNSCVSHVGRTCPQAETGGLSKDSCAVLRPPPKQSRRRGSLRVLVGRRGPPAGLKEQINCDHFCKSKLLKPFFFLCVSTGRLNGIKMLFDGFKENPGCCTGIFQAIERMSGFIVK